MSATEKQVEGRVLRTVAPWVGLGAGVFTLVALVLVLTEKEPEATPVVAANNETDAGDDGEPTTAFDVPPVGAQAGDDPLAGLPKPPPASEGVEDGASEASDLTGEDLENERKAVGSIPKGGLPKVPTVTIPVGTIERVEGSRDWIIHTVVGRETIDQIAYRYAVKPESLRLWNGIDGKAERAKKGSRLRIKARKIPPARVELQYVVKPGDSWASIGIQYGVDSADLRATNWDAGQQLTVGQIIRLWVDPVVFHWVATEDDDPTKVRPGAVGVGPPQNGRLVNGVKLPDSSYYKLRLPPSSYGTTFAVEALLRGIVLFEARADYERPLTFGSMSWRHGGDLTGHVSHQSGRDLDIGLPLLEKYPEWFPVEPKRIDWETTWKLVTAMFDTGDVVVVFLDYDLQKPLFKAATKLGATEEERKQYLQYPRGPKAQGLIRHSRGHTKHVHVRFACGPYEVECADNSTLGAE
ncbi:MAG: LysM peptidoglycan-binding domain-containing protein [Myxococcota bacterium]